MTWLALLLIPVYAAADRMVGGAGRRSFAFGGVLVVSLGIAWLTQLWPLAIMAPVWVVYRSLPFKGVFGSTTPRGFGERAATLFRHALPAVATLPLLADRALGADWRDLALVLAGYAVAALILAITYTAIIDDHIKHGEPEDGENAWIEAGRGAAFGLALAGWAILA